MPADPPAQPEPGGLMWLMRRTARAHRPLPEVLADWGLPPEEGAEICEGTVGGDPGFLIVTPTRFAFVPTGVPRAAARVAEQHALDDLVGVDVHRRELVARWRDGRTVVSSDRRQIARLAGLLRPLLSK